MDPSTFLSTEFIGGLAIAAIALVAEHYYFQGRLSKPKSYAVGTGTLLFGQGWWLAAIGRLDVWIGLLIFALVGGGVVILSYQHDGARRGNATGQALKAQTPPPLYEHGDYGCN